MADYDHVAEQMIIQLYERINYIRSPPSEKLELSSTAMMKIKVAWSTFVGADASAIGFDAFVGMFKKEPKTQGLFDFASGSSSAQMQNSSRLIFHVTRVVKFISNVMDNLDRLEEVVPQLRRLGGRHGSKGYNVPKDYFKKLGESFEEMLAKKFGSNWSVQHKETWFAVFNWIIKQLNYGQEKYNLGSSQ